MSIPGAANPLLLAQLDTGYKITRSLRFNSSDSAYCGRTFSSAGNRQTWTLSWWMKRSKIGGVNEFIFGTGGSNTVAQMFFDSSEKFRYGTFTGEPLVTAAVFRDVSAWYHFVFVHNTANATPADRLILYVNGVRADTSTYTAPTQNSDGAWNRAVGHVIGGTADGGSGAAQPSFNGYLADVHFIDGQALTPSSFTEVSATTGQLIPKQYTGSFGTNGFWLKFSDNSAATATTLGKDYSGNSNNWSPTNLSVTAGAGNDSTVDTPTSYGTGNSGGDVRGNYCTINPLQNANGDTFSNGNLEVTSSVSGYGCHTSTFATPLTGKWYAEVTIGNSNALYSEIGLVDSTSNFTNTSIPSSLRGVAYASWEGKYYKDSVSASYGTAANLANGDVIGIAYDAGAGTVTFYKNSSSLGLISGVTARNYYFAAADYWSSQSAIYIWNFGQRAWTYPANASGFKALCDTNLPAPVVAKSSDYFQTVLYTGNGGTQTVSGLSFSPDLVWLKGRSVGYSHQLYDQVRSAGKLLNSNSTNAESTVTDNLTAFTSSGFTLGNDAGTNQSSATYVAWAFDAGTTTTTNTAGSITSQVRANASAGFSIVTFTTDGTTKTVGHGLGVKPSLVIVKSRNVVGNWLVITDILGSMQYGRLESTAAFTGIGYSAPTSSVFQYNDNNGNTQVAYCFAPVAGYSSFGSYTGNGSSDGPFVFCNFRPAFVLVKGTSTGYIWTIEDSKRDTYNGTSKYLQPQASDAEGSVSAPHYDFTSNGFKIRTTDSAWNQSGVTYIYAAFAENPFQYARAR